MSSYELKARELSHYDDISNSLCVDPLIGFPTHKMSPRFRHVKGKYSVLKAVIEEYTANGDVDKAYEALICGNWSRTLLMGKPKLQLEAFKEHVRSIFRYSIGRTCCCCIECQHTTSPVLRAIDVFLSFDPLSCTYLPFCHMFIWFHFHYAFSCTYL